MLGPGILARTLSRATKRGSSGRAWQYHSRSDHHSKVLCWAIVFDLLRECDAFIEQAKRGQVGLALNHVMVGPINKTLDLVVCRVPPTRKESERTLFADLVGQYEIQLDAQERMMLEDLPPIQVERPGDVSEVLIALEAKACMTEHSKSIPRLHAEILATGFLAKQAAPNCITASHTIVNAASSFVTPSGKRKKVNQHSQPEDALAVIGMLGKALPTRLQAPTFGYDVLGVTVLECRNDGSPVTIVTGAPAPSARDFYQYDRMIRSLCSEYRRRFATVV